MTPSPPVPPLLPPPLALPPAPPAVVTVTPALPLPPVMLCEMLCACAVPPVPPLPALPSPPVPPVVLSVVVSAPLLVVALPAVMTAVPPLLPVVSLVPLAPVIFTDCATAPKPVAETLPVTVIPLLMISAVACPLTPAPPAALDEAVPPTFVAEPLFAETNALASPPAALGDPAAPPVAWVWISRPLAVVSVTVELAVAAPPLPPTPGALPAPPAPPNAFSISVTKPVVKPCTASIRDEKPPLPPLAPLLPDRLRRRSVSR